MIKSSKDWNKVNSIRIMYTSLTLAELLDWVRENVPSETKHEDILLDFQIEGYDNYNLDGEKYHSIDAELELLVKRRK